VRSEGLMAPTIIASRGVYAAPKLLAIIDSHQVDRSIPTCLAR
jgi:hypothetical protein